MSAPAGVRINGTLFNIAEPTGMAPFSFTAGGLNLTGNDVRVELLRKNSWVFLSEVQFNTVAAVPEPETYALMLAGLGVIGVVAKRRRQRPD